MNKYHKNILNLFILFLSIPIFSFAQQKCNSVDLFIGTASDNGQVDPAACIPYSMVRVSPDMIPRSHSGYDYSVTKTSGFSVNRISGIGCSGAGGNLSIRPAKKETELNIVKATESATPGYYTASLDNDVKAELTATNNIAIERFHYPKDEDAILTLDVTAGFEKARDYQHKVVSANEIQGYIKMGNTCNHGEYTLYFNLKTNKDFTIVSTSKEKIEIKFSNENTKPVEIRIAVSPLGLTAAKEENSLTSTESFDHIKKEAANKWENMLSRIDIKGATDDEKTLFYTSLYRVFLSPADVTSYDGKYLATDGSTQFADDFMYYSSWSMWDSYRTKFPLITLLDAPTSRNISRSLSKLFLFGKKDWATSFESTPTVRTEHSMSVILDNYRKGIQFDLENVYKGFEREMETLQTKRPDQAFETSIDLWSMSQFAEILGKTEDAKKYAIEAKELFLKTWESDFKNITDDFTKMRGSGLYQGTRWQYRWVVPQYLDLMIETVGKEKLLEQLEYYFDNNLSNQTNEPGLHAPYLFNRLGRPERNQQVVRDILTKEMKHLYGGNAEYAEPVYSKTFKLKPEGFLPEMDEDDGTMCAYYVFGAIGLYPLIVGEPWYEITSPLYKEITIKLDGGKKLTIKTTNRKSQDAPIKNVTFNGDEISDYRINHNDLVKGGVLELKH